jgi:sulfite exporter TauE/SafE
MLALAGAVLLASLLGSVHCAAMCGAFACFAAEGSHRGSAHGPYHLGRLLAYLTLGLAAGATGALLDRGGVALGLGRLASVAMGVLLVGWGAQALLGSRQGRLAELRLPAAWQRGLGRGMAALRAWPAALRGLATGMATGLLPCGWLWVFVAVASGTGRALDGAAIMAVFWLGSVPALVAVVAGAQRLAGPWRRRLPRLSAVMLVTLGLVTLAAHLDLIPVGHWLHRLVPVAPLAHVGGHGG